MACNWAVTDASPGPLPSAESQPMAGMVPPPRERHDVLVEAYAKAFEAEG